MAFLAFLTWSCADALVKYVGARVPIYSLIFYDMLVVVLFMAVLGAWGKYGGLREALSSRYWKWHAFRGLIICMQFMAEVYGFTHMSLARTYTLLFTMPLLTVPLALLFMGEKPGVQKWSAILLGFAGVLVVLRPGMIPLDLAAMLTLFSATNFAISNLIARHIASKGEEKPLTCALIAQIVALLGTVPFYLTHYSVPGPQDLFLITLIGIITGLGFMFLTKAFFLAHTTTVAPLHYTQILWATVFGYLLFNDKPDLWVLAGAVLIIASGLWLIKQEKNPSLQL